MVQREYKFANKGHTEGNLLTEHLSRMEVTYAGYSVDDGECLQLCIDAADPGTLKRRRSGCAPSCAAASSYRRTSTDTLRQAQ